MPLLTVEELTLRYHGKSTPAVDAASFSVNKGEIFGLLGPSGSGKTSVLRVIGGFERPDGGRVTLGGVTIAATDCFVQPEKRHIGFVFQEFALFPHLTVLENVMFGLRNGSRADRQRQAGDILERAQLADQADRHPHHLSGGQQQRVAIARAMAPRPHVILMDEPFGSLDPSLRDDALKKIRAVFRDREMTSVFVTHDQGEALSFADRIAVMRDGRIEQIGTPEQLYAKPSTRFVAAFIGGANIIPGKADGDYADTPIGRIPLDREAAGDVTVAIRPEHLELVAAENGFPEGKVIGRMFHGHDLTMRIRIGETEFTVWDDYRCPYQVGQTVTVKPREKGVVVD